MSKISVIVPIYNTAEYLGECIDSILMQTHQNLEVILIDDGSTDDSGKIADQYAEKDLRVIVRHTENGGVSNARNRGIDISTGEYIAFVDSDDALDVRYFETLLMNAKKADADISFCISHIIGSPMTANMQDNLRFEWGGREALQHLLQADLFSCAVNKMYQAELLKNIRFSPNIAINEDLLLNYKLFAIANSVVFENKKLYSYRHREGSASRTRFSAKQLDVLKVNRYIVEDLSDPQLKNIAQCRYFGALSACHKGTIQTPELLEEQKEIEKTIRKELHDIVKNPHIRFRKKVELFIQGYMPAIYPMIYRMLKTDT